MRAVSSCYLLKVVHPLLYLLACNKGRYLYRTVPGGKVDDTGTYLSPIICPMAGDFLVSIFGLDFSKLLEKYDTYDIY